MVKTLIILYLWQATAGGAGYVHNSWVNQGTYVDMVVCERAARRLKLPADKYECIDSGIPINQGK